VRARSCRSRIGTNSACTWSRAPHASAANFVREVGPGAPFRDAGAGPLFRDLGPGPLFRDSDAGTPVGDGPEARLRAGTAPLLSESDATAPFRAVVTGAL
jgi:hypothetical protein